MNSVIEEWRAKAAADFATARRELAAQDEPNYDAVCFHAQQCVEKVMKALLIFCDAEVPRTHDLVFLAAALKQQGLGWDAATEDLRFLTRAAVAFRYPGESAERADAEEALRLCDQLWQSLHPLLTRR